jgi:uncharacterized membrane protein YgcG
MRKLSLNDRDESQRSSKRANGRQERNEEESQWENQSEYKEEKKKEGKEEKKEKEETKERKLQMGRAKLFESNDFTKSVGAFLNNREVAALKNTSWVIKQPLVKQEINCEPKCYPVKSDGPHDPKIVGECSDVCNRLADRRIKELSSTLFNNNSSFAIKLNLENSSEKKLIIRSQNNGNTTSFPYDVNFKLVKDYKRGPINVSCNLKWFIPMSEYKTKQIEWKASDTISKDFFLQNPSEKPTKIKWPSMSGDPVVRERLNKALINLQFLKLEKAFEVRNKLHKSNAISKTNYNSNSQNFVPKIEDNVLLSNLDLTLKELEEYWILSRLPPVIKNTIVEFSRRCPFWNVISKSYFYFTKCFVKRSEEAPEHKEFMVTLGFTFAKTNDVNLSKDELLHTFVSFRKPLENFDKIVFTNRNSKIGNNEIILLARTIKNWWNLNLQGHNTTRMIIKKDEFDHVYIEEPSDSRPYNGAPKLISSSNDGNDDADDDKYGTEGKSESGPGLSLLSSLPPAPSSSSSLSSSLSLSSSSSSSSLSSLLRSQNDGQGGGGGNGGDNGGGGGGGGGQRAAYTKNGKRRKTRKRIFTRKTRANKKGFK